MPRYAEMCRDVPRYALTNAPCTSTITMTMTMTIRDYRRIEQRSQVDLVHPFVPHYIRSWRAQHCGLEFCQMCIKIEESWHLFEDAFHQEAIQDLCCDKPSKERVSSIRNILYSILAHAEYLKGLADATIKVIAHGQ